MTAVAGKVAATEAVAMVGAAMMVVETGAQMAGTRAEVVE